MTLHKKLFFVLVLLLPVNLAKHFIYPGAYIDGILVDYLIPTLYLTDLLIAAIATIWLFEKRKVPAGVVKLFVPFALFVGLSVVFSVRPISSLFVYAQMLAHIFIAVYAAAEIDAEKDFYTLVKITGVLAILLGALVLAQWAKQGAVFNNYAFFGEQPYSAATLGIAKQALFDKAYVLPYATFRHPNALGGFLSVVLVWLMYGMTKRRVFAVPFILGALALFLTFSQVAWAAFVFGILALFLIERFGKGGVLASLAATATIVFFGIGLLFLNADGSRSVPASSAFRNPSTTFSCSFCLNREFLRLCRLSAYGCLPGILCSKTISAPPLFFLSRCSSWQSWAVLTITSSLCNRHSFYFG
ncbi:MAG: hypothetical protein UX44_C0020G0002 [candidate division WWE3 bacterium GW2011_GWA1_46_21]|uniref:O-antigen polymerase n=1 Tax=candidate division WWE3 bacterium GW2011_GWA1_46_21 TaxID=1619107 RepID=A0A0G1PCH9_UNCKA|nr:MAG: hypothetical protein UX44_C0020G0002 [candidate division WWE3 bacterium GW2011_GWA1_46_21]